MGDVWQSTAKDLHAWLLSGQAEKLLQLFSARLGDKESAQQWYVLGLEVLLFSNIVYFTRCPGHKCLYVKLCH